METNGGGVFRSFDSGQVWTQSNRGLSSPYVLFLYAEGPYPYAGTRGGGALFTDQELFLGSRTMIYRSTDVGVTWEKEGLTEIELPVLALVTDPKGS